jgi:hypothetical protein
MAHDDTTPRPPPPAADQPPTPHPTPVISFGKRTAAKYAQSQKPPVPDPPAPLQVVDSTPPTPPKLSKKLRNRKLRQRRILALARRRQGWDYDAIARELGVSEAVAANDVRQMLYAQPAENVEVVRKMTGGQLNMLIRAHMPQALDPKNIRAADLVAKLLEQVARLYGAYAPIKWASTDPTGTSWRPLAVAVTGLSQDELAIAYKIQRLALGAAPPNQVDGVVVKPDRGEPGPEGDL